ncbi:MAG: metal-dependent hydrolase, partial [Armatimonadetes bacterium]|nr:metal-dependent hydrolase [Armatimonadota bacterium]
MENVIHSVQIVRSDRRVKTISAQVKDGVLTVSVPSRFSDAEAQRWADRMRRRLSLRIEKASLNESNGLERRAQRLNQQYFGGALQYASISYVSNQNSRWGS